ncbi:MAG: hypothetical protein II954_00735, partial [Synergistaceae bacterium]|nr:hypothetical protein [Synergistaceae bacterium]
PDPEPTPEPEPTPSVDPEPSAPLSPAVDVQDQTVQEKIINTLRSLSEALSNLITTNTEVAELPASASGGERSIEDVSDEELAAIPKDETPAVILPIIVVQKSAVYVFGVQLDNLEVGAVIVLHLMAESTGTNAAFYSSAEGSEAYTFLDDDGNEVTTVPANKHVNVAAFMEAGKTYAPIITVKDSGTTPTPTPSPEPSTPTTPTTPDTPTTPTTPQSAGSSSGGCETFGASSILVLLAGILMRRKNR